jgi:hypothetical protein
VIGERLDVFVSYAGPDRPWAEWAAVLAEPPGGRGRRRLVPVRVAKVSPPPILQALVFRDVFDLPE